MELADEVRADFPIFENNPGFIYFDSAATSQKPRQVLEKEREIYERLNANVHRGIYKIAEEITEEYERARERIAGFVSAAPEELVFTRNTTEAINLVAYALLPRLRPGDRIVTTLLEHHSNLLPWRRVASLSGARVELVEIDEQGRIDADDFEKKIRGARVFAVTQVSNVAGTIVDVKGLVKRAREEGAYTVVDGAQAVPHMRVNVKEIGADFYAFSGHKMMGPTGIGALYGRKELLEELEPPFTGGEMVKEAHADGQVWNDVPWKFEPGTPNYVGAIALAEAVNYLSRIGMERVEDYERRLSGALLEAVERVPGLRYVGGRERAALVAFVVKDVHPHDIAAFLDSRGIGVRSGFHCAQPLHERLGFMDGTARASLYIYNTFSEIDKFAEALKELASLA